MEDRGRNHEGGRIAMDDWVHDTQEPVGLVGARSLFLALYLVLLAFFIALISLSTFEETKARAVVDSLWATFAGPKSPFAEPVFPSQAGRVIAPARQWMADMGDLFRTEIPAVRITERAGGEVLEVMVSATSVFQHDSTRLRPGRGRLLDGIAAALVAAPAGLPRVVEAALTTGTPSTARLPEPEGLLLRRTAALARAFHDRGVPAAAIRAALVPGPLNQVILTFRTTADPGDLSRPDSAPAPLIPPPPSLPSAAPRPPDPLPPGLVGDTDPLPTTAPNPASPPVIPPPREVRP